jgi:hypothetical protein
MYGCIRGTGILRLAELADVSAPPQRSRAAATGDTDYATSDTE